MNIFNEIKKHIDSNDRVVIAIDGPSGSGKSTLSDELARRYDCLLIHIDDYFLPASMKTESRLDTPGGNFHHERLIEEVLLNLDDDSVFINSFDCRLQKLGTPTSVSNKKIMIIEGVYSHHPMLTKYYTYKIFLTVDPLEQRKRILNRNGDKMLQKWMTEWIPLENKYFNEFSIQKNADIQVEL